MEPKGIVAASLPKWIPVTERLPEDFISVLVHMPEQSPMPTVREGYHVNHIFVIPALMGVTTTVAHWMPLPEPPKEVKV